MTTRNAQILDLYSDYLIASFGQTSATGMAKLVSHLSHDQITRFLNSESFTDKDLWKIVKPQVRRIESPEGLLIIDDTVEEKPYTDESELICWHFDHTVGRSVKGINLVSALYQCSTRLNHFAQKAQLYQAALASAFAQLQILKAAMPEAAITS